MPDDVTRVLQELLKTLEAFRGSDSLVLDLWTFLFLIFVSLLASFVLMILYTVFYESRATGSQIHRSFPLLALGITTLFVAIQFSLPLSLGLLGALSIIRFRTPIKEPEEIGFIMVLIASSIACATAKLEYLGVLLVLSFVALLALKYGSFILGDRLNDGFISVTLPNEEYEVYNDRLKTVFVERLKDGRLYSITRSEGGTTISYTFDRISQGALSELEAALTSFERPLEYNVLLNKQATL